MNYHDQCSHCGHRITAYTLHLNKPLTRAFIAFCEVRIRLGRPVSKGQIALTNAQYSNFQNLRHFGFIEQMEVGHCWDFTPLGIEWFMNRATVLSPVAHLGGETLPVDHLAWSTHKGLRRSVCIQSILGEEWKPREYYQAEKKDAVA